MATSERKGGLAVIGFCALIILIGFIYSLMQVSEMRHPVIYIISVLLVTAFAAYFLPKVWRGYNLSGESKFIWMGGGIVLLWLVVALGVAAGVNTARGECIPKEVLIHNNGYIPNPDKYLSFHTQCPGNTTLYDNETKAYISENNKLPSWIVIDGVTKDAVGWVKAHGLPMSVANEIADNGGFIPEMYLK